MKTFRISAVAMLLALVMASFASAQCAQGRVDQTNLLLGQELLARNSARAVTDTGCTTCQRQQALTAVPKEKVELFTLPAPPTKKYVLAEVQEPTPAPTILYMTSVTPAPTPAAAASASAGGTAASTSATTEAPLPFIAELPRQSLRENSTACGGGGCGRNGLLRRAFSGFGGRRTKTVSRSFSSTTTVN